jgi:formate-dependent nitrite reductase membrane component NrfD
MPVTLKRIYYSPRAFDVLFGVAGSLSLAGIVLDAGRPYPAIEAAAEPLEKGGALIGAILASAILAVICARIDQKHADDFVFHTLTKSALIAMLASFFALAVWQVLFAGKFGDVSSSRTMVAILVASWSLSYFYTRLRGTGA